MTRNPFVRLEAACANAVERAFAFAFPSALEPVVIARKLALAFEASSVAASRNGRRFVVRLAPTDYARLRSDLPYLERQWHAMLVRLAERARRPERSPEVSSLADAVVATGTVTIVTEPLAAPQRLTLRVRKGIAVGAFVPLDRTFTIGRDAGCELVLADPRMSRRHVTIVCGEDVRFEDLDSSNGTYFNGVRLPAGNLACGDVLGLGDSELFVDAERTGGVEP